MQGITFGMLTASVHGFSFDELDINQDGYLTEEEVVSVLREKNVDILDLSSMDKDADQKVTKEEYILWDQEFKISAAMTSFKNTIYKDFIGQDNSYIINAISKLENYQKEFIKYYTSNSLDITKMAEVFCSNLPLKYSEIKNDILNNNDTNVKKVVIENVIQYFINGGINNNGQQKLLYNNQTTYLPEAAINLYRDDLGKAADAYIREYKGNNLEYDLTKYLINYLLQTDKSNMDDAVTTWKDEIKDLENLPIELALLKTKNKAKAFLIRALQEGVSITLGGITVRTEVSIMPALAQYKNYKKLIIDLNAAIDKLSDITKFDKLTERALGKEDVSVQGVSNPNKSMK